MYLFSKFVNFSLRTNCSIEFNFFYAKKLSNLNLRNMADIEPMKKSRGLSYVPAIQVLGSGALGVPSNVVLICGNVRYLINSGEGSQKLGSEYRLGLERISHVFITSPLWKNISGLLGLALSYQKPNAGEFVVHGHACIEHIFSGVNKFVSLRFSQPKVEECQNYEEFSDGNISVKYIYLYSSSSRSVSPVKGESSGTENEFASNAKEGSYIDSGKQNSYLSKKHENKKKMNKKSHGKSSLNKFEKSRRSKHSYVISYIFQTNAVAGTLLYEKCMEFGVPPGPLLGVLKSGKDVTLNNGKLVRSVDVKEPDLPGTNIIVIDCPTTDYLDSLLREPIYRDYQSGKNFSAAVIHFSSSEVVKNQEYQKWIRSFPKNTKHLFLNEDNKLSGSVSIQRQQFKLNYLIPTIFPLLQDAGIPDFPRAENSSVEQGHILLPNQCAVSDKFIYSDQLYFKCEDNSFICGETLCKLNLNPKWDYDYTKCLVLKKDEFLKEMLQNDVTGEIEKFKEKLKNLDLTLEANKKIYPKIVFLGTGSGKPSKVRNTSGILIFLEENKCILFDCGENTYNQLVNFYGVNRVAEILRNLLVIYVSHLHVDHHMGLITLLKQRVIAFNEENELLWKKLNEQISEHIWPKFQPVYLLAPLQIRRWLSLYSEKFEDISGLFDLLPNSFLEEDNNDLMDKKENCKKMLNLSSLMTTSVCHCAGSFGISIVHINGCKITYSGDTRPCDALVKLGMNSDILIHEATFEDAYAYEAKLKSHSTTCEAINIGRKMNAKYILLTHFSQRYCYLPVIENYFKNFNVGIAFDFMEVPYNKLPLLSTMLEALPYIFSNFEPKIKVKQDLFLDLKRKQNDTNFSEENSFENTEISAKIMKHLEQ